LSDPARKNRAVIASIQSLDAQTVRSTVVQLPLGRAGVARTLELLRDSVHQAMFSDPIRALALSIVARVAGKNYVGEARAVQDWVRDNIRYVRDISGAELLQSPGVTLQRKQGDCDDHTALVAALLASIGHVVRAVAVGKQPDRFAHVYCEVNIDGDWLPVETTEDWPLGQGPDGVRARMSVDITAPANAAELSGLFSFAKDKFKSIVNDVTHPDDAFKNSISTIKTAIPGAITGAITGFATGGPYGALAGGVAGGAISIAQGEVQKYSADKASAQYADAIDKAAQQLAADLDMPAMKDAFEDRLKAAADPSAEIAKIAAEYAPTSAAPGVAGSVADLFDGPEWISGVPNKAVGIGGAVLLLVMVLR
jgi:hypothetical protein